MMRFHIRRILPVLRALRIGIKPISAGLTVDTQAKWMSCAARRIICVFCAGAKKTTGDSRSDRRWPQHTRQTHSAVVVVGMGLFGADGRGVVVMRRIDWRSARAVEDASGFGRRDDLRSIGRLPARLAANGVIDMLMGGVANSIARFLAFDDHVSDRIARLGLKMNQPAISKRASHVANRDILRQLEQRLNV